MKTRAFTLIELPVVIAIIAILAVIYWDVNTTTTRFQAWHYNPPDDYDNRWNGD